MVNFGSCAVDTAIVVTQYDLNQVTGRKVDRELG
jgi:hypothetical protein